MTKPKHEKVWMTVQEAAAKFHGSTFDKLKLGDDLERICENLLCLIDKLVPASSPSEGCVRVELEPPPGSVAFLHREDFEAWYQDFLRRDAERRLGRKRSPE